MAKFIKCEVCNEKLSSDTCSLAVIRREVNGEEHLFCCSACADRYKKKRK